MWYGESALEGNSDISLLCLGPWPMENAIPRALTQLLFGPQCEVPGLRGRSGHALHWGAGVRGALGDDAIELARRGALPALPDGEEAPAGATSPVVRTRPVGRPPKRWNDGVRQPGKPSLWMD